MPIDDTDLHHLRVDARDAHTNAQIARWLSILALIIAAIALAVSILAWNKANDAWGNAQRAINVTQGR